MAIRAQSLSEYLHAREVVNESRQSLGPWLRQARTAANLTQVELSELTGKSQAYLSQIETNAKTPSYESLTLITSVLEEKGAFSGQDNSQGKDEGTQSEGNKDA